MLTLNVVRKRKVYNERRSASCNTYKALHRFDQDNVQWLSSRIFNTSETRGGAVSSKQKVEITLRYLANPGFQTHIAEQTGFHQSTVSRVINETVPLIAGMAGDWIQFPSNGSEKQCAKERWFAEMGFPCCIGAIDCTHVRIDKPSGSFGDEYINRKGFPSLIVQATCNEKCVFTSVDVSWPGSVHDNRIFRTSQLYR